MNPQQYVLSSRVRLARNIKGFPFPNNMSEEQAEQVIQHVTEAVSGGNEMMSRRFQLFRMKATPESEKRFFLEKHLISRELYQSPISALYLGKDENISIMLNEEDHLRIQSIYDGYEVDRAYEGCRLMDNLLEETLRFSFSSKYGYLTACPTNLGTGMRCSVMVHLPGLAELSYMAKMIEELSKRGFTVRGLYGEGSKAEGNLFQISNQVTLGVSESELLDRLKGITEDILRKEEQAEFYLRNTGGAKFADRIGRRVGALKYASLMSRKEAMNALSDIKMGRNLGMVRGVKGEEIKDAFLEISDVLLMKDGKERGQMEEERSRYLRNKFKSMEFQVKELNE